MLKSEAFDDIYFSPEDGLAESEYVFLHGNKLLQRWQNQSFHNFCIFETGFGTGLNALMSAYHFQKNTHKDQTLDFVSVEKFPLHKDDICKALKPWEGRFGAQLQEYLDQTPMRIESVQRILLGKNVTITVFIGDINDIMPDLPNHAPVDAWYLDGFAPSKNPEMWSDTVFEHMKRLSHSETSYASFTAAGVVREKLAQNGFSVERIKGYGRKRHMIIGQALEQHIKVKKNETKQAVVPQKIAVIGAGLAGGAMLHALSQSNKTYGIDLIEAHEKPAQGASGNPLGLINPKLTAVKTPHSDYYSSAYAHCLTSIKRLGDHNALNFEQIGSVHLAFSEDKRRRFNGYCSALGWHKDHIEQLSPTQTQDIFVPSNNAAASVFKEDMSSLLYPDAAVVNPAALTQHYIETAIRADNIDLNLLYKKKANSTDLNKENYNAIIICCADGAAHLSPLDALPMNTVRGQISTLSKEAFDGHLQCRKILCFGGYLTPYHEEANGYILGASFKPWDDSSALKAEDDEQNLERLNEQLAQPINQKSISPLRAAMRCSSKDRAPIIGRAEGLHTQTTNIYLSLAHGSHGIISSSYAAAIIKAQLEGRFIPATNSILNAVSSKRFFKDKV